MILRRQALILLSGAAGVTAVGGGIYATARFLEFGEGRRSRSRIPLGDTEAVSALRGVQDHGGVWIVRDAQGLYALDGRCTHLGCQVRWDSKHRHFACPCHGSLFDGEGTVLSGPGTRPLARYPFRRTAEGGIYVDLTGSVGPGYRCELGKGG